MAKERKERIAAQMMAALLSTRYLDDVPGEKCSQYDTDRDWLDLVASLAVEAADALIDKLDATAEAVGAG